MKGRHVRSVVAVLAGLATIVVLSTGVDTVLEVSGVFPSLVAQRSDGFDTLWMLALALTYLCVFAAVGGYVTARLAPSAPMRHVLVLVAVGALLAVGGAAAAAGITPAWYTFAVILLTPVAAWIGGRRATHRRADRRHQPAAFQRRSQRPAAR